MRTPDHHLDATTAEQMLDGARAAQDLPSGLAGVAELLAAARRPGAATEQPTLVVAMTQAIVDPPPTILTAPRRTSVIGKILTAKAAVIVGAITLSAGAAGAATGSLPDAAQDGLSKAASHVGVDLPRSDGSKGADISDRAKSDDTTGVDKGADVSDKASDGKSRAGQDHPSADDHPGAPASTPAVTPNSGGTGTAGTASNGASDTGTSTAGEQTDAAENGSANTDDRPTPSTTEHPTPTTTEHPTADDHPTVDDHSGGRP